MIISVIALALALLFRSRSFLMFIHPSYSLLVAAKRCRRRRRCRYNAIILLLVVLRIVAGHSRQQRS
jgi:hypothetical protein